MHSYTFFIFAFCFSCASRISKESGSLSFCYLRLLVGTPGVLLAALGRFLVALGRSWALLGRSWALLGRSWPLLARSWPSLGRSWPLLGRSWPLLARSWPLLARSWALKNGYKKRSKIDPRKNIQKIALGDHFWRCLGSQERRSREPCVFLFAKIESFSATPVEILD